MSYLEAIANHQEADEAYEAAIKKQFGPKANRFSVPHKRYNKETKAAYQAKISASELQSEAFNKTLIYQ